MKNRHRRNTSTDCIPTSDPRLATLQPPRLQSSALADAVRCILQRRSVVRAGLLALVSYAPLTAATAFPPSIDLSDLDGSNGFVLNGIDPGDFSGFSVSAAGDVNGDGIDDLIVGARYANPNGPQSGESYVVFGRTTGFASPFELASLDGSNGFVLNGIDAHDDSGISVSAAGDVNGDGIDDVIVGASDADPNGQSRAGESYVVFGRTTGFASPIELSSLDGSNGFVLNGIDALDRSGGSVSTAGDVNGDGIDDLIVGGRFADSKNEPDAGESFVVFGRTTGFLSSFELSSLNGSNGFVLSGIDGGDYSGGSVSTAGDVNGDGIDDLIVGAIWADPNGNGYAGESYVVFGRTTGFPSSFELSSLDGSNGFVLNGIDTYDYSGYSVSGAGDVNGDGIDDLIVGARSADPNGKSRAGESYVVFGRTTGFPSPFELSSLDGSNGFVLNGIDAFDSSGNSVSAAGDVNGDGIDDLIVGARFAEPNGQSGAGESYVVFGRTTGFPSPFELSSLDGSNGFVLNGIDVSDRSGHSVSGAGDVNGDGIDDLIVGANMADPNFNGSAGESYVVFGSPADVDNDLVPDTEDNCIFIANSVQRDTDGDNIGNDCDPDIAVPNDCIVNFLDLNTMMAAFFSNPAQPSWNPDADLNGDDSVNFADLLGIKSVFFGTPGPSGLANDCDGS